MSTRTGTDRRGSAVPSVDSDTATRRGERDQQTTKHAGKRTTSGGPAWAPRPPSTKWAGASLEPSPGSHKEEDIDDARTERELVPMMVEVPARERRHHGSGEGSVRTVLSQLPAGLELRVSRFRLALPAVLLALFAWACTGGDTSTAEAGLNVGDSAPSFDLPAAAGGRASLDDFVGKRPVLLYFSMGPG